MSKRNTWLLRLIHVLIFVFISYYLTALVVLWTDTSINGGYSRYGPSIFAALAAFGPFGILNAFMYITRWRRRGDQD
jgi:hypothetical protein